MDELLYGLKATFVFVQNLCGKLATLLRWSPRTAHTTLLVLTELCCVFFSCSECVCVSRKCLPLEMEAYCVLLLEMSHSWGGRG